MKVFLLLVFVIYSSVCNAQIMEIVQSDLTAKELFSNAREILATVYSDCKKELDDDLGYNIVAYGRYNNLVDESEISHTMSNEFTNSTFLFFRIKISCKDYKYRYIIDDITLVQDKKIGKTINTDIVTSWMFGVNQSTTDIKYEVDVYNYSDMDSIYKRDSISYFSTQNEYNELLKKKNSAKRKERNRIYKDMGYLGNILIDKEKKFRSTRLFHDRCKKDIDSIILDIKKGMSNKNDW